MAAMTPQDALAAALHMLPTPDDLTYSHAIQDCESQAPAILAALPAGWRLTDEPEVTVEALEAALFAVYLKPSGLPGIVPVYTWSKARKDAAAILAALRGAS